MPTDPPTTRRPPLGTGGPPGRQTSTRARRFRSRSRSRILADLGLVGALDPAHALALTAVASLHRVRVHAGGRSPAPAHRLEAALRGRRRARRAPVVIAVTTLVLVACRPSTRSATSTARSRRRSTSSVTFPIIGPRLREAERGRTRCRQWIDDFPKRLDVQHDADRRRGERDRRRRRGDTVRAAARDHARARRRTPRQHGPPARSRTPKIRRRPARPARLRRRRPLHRGHACSWPRWWAS